MEDEESEGIELKGVEEISHFDVENGENHRIDERSSSCSSTASINDFNETFLNPDLSSESTHEKSHRNACFIAIIICISAILISIIIVLSIHFSSSNSSADSSTPPTPSLNPPIPSNQPPQLITDGSFIKWNSIHSIPHDINAFTQGFLYYAASNVFYESNGRRGLSNVRELDVETGSVLKERSINSNIFSEGMTYHLIDDALVQISWTSGRGFVYDRKSFDVKREWKYSGEGWGITTELPEGKRLFMSDGSSQIRILNATSEAFDELGRISVTLGGRDIARLNELEYINGEIWANVWLTNEIVRIDPESGNVNSRLDLTGLLKDEDRVPNHRPDVLNGIAFDANTNRIWLTGKLWPKIYLVEVKQ
mmetsp:Transcript_3854/g.6732  ORF Transcript_3854/g.6732 Transcript_3854/m.6732 type:complete len:366 (-) Transcript_3854:870-1967(-)